MRLFDLSLFSIFLLLITFLSGCETRFRELPSGLKYKLVNQGNGPKFKDGMYAIFNMEIRDENDSVLYSTIENGYPVSKYYNDSIWDESGQIYEGLNKLRVGDSAIFKINCYNLYRVSWNMEIPDNLDSSAMLTGYVGAYDLVTPLRNKYYIGLYAVKKRENELKLAKIQLEKDLAQIDKHLAVNGITPLVSESGLRYIIHRDGDGIGPKSGDQVTVQYKGYFMDGTKFDDTTGKEPFMFTLGASHIIDGWNEGVKLMSKGSKFTLYMPSGMAYGPDGIRNIINSNQVLVYEAEMVDIKFK